MKPQPYLSVSIAVIMLLFSQTINAQFGNFYSSSGYSNFINTMIDNYIWKSSMDKYTKDYYEGKITPSKGTTTKPREPDVVPEYRRYPGQQFKSTGTRLTFDEYFGAIQVSEPEKKELREVVDKIFKDWENAAYWKGLSNDWALAYVSYVGLNNHIYYGLKDPPIVPFEQNVGLRDVVAEQAINAGMFDKVTDKQKQELYELLILISGLTYHFYEKALKENNEEELKNCKLQAEQNLLLMGIKPQ